MYNSTLKPFKRKEGVEYYPGTTIKKNPNAKPLKRTKIRPVSKKTAKRNANYGKVAKARSVEMFGIDCGFVFGATQDLCTHHFDKNRNNNRPENLFRLCVFHHDHSGNDGLDMVNNRIIKKQKETK